jgi:hypothetical protein
MLGGDKPVDGDEIQAPAKVVEEVTDAVLTEVQGLPVCHSTRGILHIASAVRIALGS